MIFYPTKPTSKKRSKKRNAGSHLQEVQLTAEQIKEIYALPATPQYIVDVIIPEGSTIRCGIANSIDAWGTGGGIQYDLMGERIGKFVNPRPLE